MNRSKPSTAGDGSLGHAESLKKWDLLLGLVSPWRVIQNPTSTMPLRLERDQLQGNALGQQTGASPDRQLQVLQL